MSKLDLTRQAGLIDNSKLEGLAATIIGCGAIGSHVALALAKMGLGKLLLYDHDTVESHNLPNQGFGIPDLGRYKVTALDDRITTDYGTEVSSVFGKVTPETILEGTPVIICAVDDMGARRFIWEIVQKTAGVKLYIETRMAAMIGRLFTLRLPEDAESYTAYEDTLYTNEEAIDAPCTERATVFCAQGLSAYIASSVFCYVKGTPAPMHSIMSFDTNRVLANTRL